MIAPPAGGVAPGKSSAYSVFCSPEYVQLYVDFLLNKSIYRQFAAFYHGFHSVCASDALMVSK